MCGVFVIVIAIIKDHGRLKYAEVQSQQMAFTQKPLLSNDPTIVTYGLIFSVNDIVSSLTTLLLVSGHWNRTFQI